MRVLFNALQAANRSGTGEYSLQLARHLPAVAGDIDVHILWPGDLDLPPELTALDGTEKLIRHRATGTAGRLLFDHAGLLSLVRRMDAALVHFPASVANQMGRLKNIVTIHDVAFVHDPGWFRADRALFYRLTIGRSARRATRIIADSMATKADLIAHFGISDDRIDVVYLGVDASFQSASDDAKQRVRERYTLPDRFFLFYGTIEPRKNVDRLIQAWSTIAARHEIDLVIAGRFGWKTQSVQEACERSPHKRRIHFPGFISRADLPAVISCARALAWPSLWEGFGLPPLEAMACGVPVLTSHTSSLPEICGDAALLIDPRDSDSIAAGLDTLAADDGRCAALAAKGATRAAQFTWQATARGVVQSYQRVKSCAL